VKLDKKYVQRMTLLKPNECFIYENLNLSVKLLLQR